MQRPFEIGGGRRGRFGCTLFCHLAQTGGDPERAALSGHAVDAGLAAHQVRQALVDRQAETGAAVAPRGRTVRLFEGLEDPGLLVGGYADAAVLHFEADQAVTAAILDYAPAQRDAAGFGEFHGVAQVIEQGLRQPRRVADQARRQPGHLAPEGEPLRLDPLDDDGAQVGGQFAEVERDLLDHHPPGLDLGKVEDVVEDAHQVLCGAGNLAQLVLLLRARLGTLQQMGHADDGIHRRADFVAHIGQERALAAAGGFGTFACLVQLLGAGVDQFLQVIAMVFEFGLNQQAVADIGKSHHGADNFAIPMLHVGTVFDGKSAAVGTPEDFVRDVGVFAAREGRENRALCDRIGGAIALRVVQQDVHVMPDRGFGCRVAQHLERGCIDEGAFPGQIDAVEPFAHRGQHQAHAFLAGAQQAERGDCEDEHAAGKRQQHEQPFAAALDASEFVDVVRQENRDGRCRHRLLAEQQGAEPLVQTQHLGIAIVPPDAQPHCLEVGLPVLLHLFALRQLRNPVARHGAQQQSRVRTEYDDAVGVGNKGIGLGCPEGEFIDIPLHCDSADKTAVPDDRVRIKQPRNSRHLADGVLISQPAATRLLEISALAVVGADEALRRVRIARCNAISGGIQYPDDIGLLAGGMNQQPRIERTQLGIVGPAPLARFAFERFRRVFEALQSLHDGRIERQYPRHALQQRNAFLDIRSDACDRLGRVDGCVRVNPIELAVRVIAGKQPGGGDPQAQQQAGYFEKTRMQRRIRARDKNRGDGDDDDGRSHYQHDRGQDGRRQLRIRDRRIARTDEIGRGHRRVMHAGNGQPHDHGCRQMSPLFPAFGQALKLKFDPEREVGQHHRHHQRQQEQIEVVADDAVDAHGRHAGIMHGADPRTDE